MKETNGWRSDDGKFLLALLVFVVVLWCLAVGFIETIRALWKVIGCGA